MFVVVVVPLVVVVFLVVVVSFVVVVSLTVLVVVLVVLVVFLVSLVYLYRYLGMDHSVIESSSIQRGIRISCRQVQFIGSEMSN